MEILSATEIVVVALLLTMPELINDRFPSCAQLKITFNLKYCY